MGWRGIVGLGSAAVGVALVLSTSFSGKDDYLVGDLVVIASGGIFATQTVLQKMTFSRIPPATLLWNFRIASLGTQAVLWSALGLGFATLVTRPAREKTRTAVPTA